jgi:hypothetical protein
LLLRSVDKKVVGVFVRFRAPLHLRQSFDRAGSASQSVLMPGPTQQLGTDSITLVLALIVSWLKRLSHPSMLIEQLALQLVMPLLQRADVLTPRRAGRHWMGACGENKAISPCLSGPARFGYRSNVHLAAGRAAPAASWMCSCPGVHRIGTQAQWSPCMLACVSRAVTTAGTLCPTAIVER